VSDDFDVDDVAAMRRENGGKDFRLFLRQQIADGKARREKPAPVQQAKPPGYRPGAWPAGTRPPDPLKPQPPGAWEHALHRYRQDEGSDRDPCHCGGCDTTRHDPEEN
jgi:hypothetical protein